jgi:hypothetical protein
MAISQPLKLVLVPPSTSHNAAAMEEETLSLLGNRPAADMVDPFLKILPISPATKRNCLISFRPHYGFQYQIIHQYGWNYSGATISGCYNSSQSGIDFIY